MISGIYIKTDISSADRRNASLGGADFNGLTGANLLGARATRASPGRVTRFQANRQF
jgi:uncharacterized protein YjbI with pentapeptide repeats